MTGGRSSTKNSGKPARQLLFSDTLLHSMVPPSALVAQQAARHHTMTDSAQESTVDRILQELSAGDVAQTFDPPLEFQRAHRWHQEIRCGQPRPHDHCLPPPSYASPPAHTVSPHTQSLSDGRTGDLDISGLSKETSEQRRCIPGPPTQATPDGGEIWPVRTGENVDYDPVDPTLFSGWPPTYGHLNPDSTSGSTCNGLECSAPWPRPRRVGVRPPPYRLPSQGTKSGKTYEQP
ncbi:hypothetical protein NDU88_003747 [Pleurodeles waltl]|uniref:Uncharacterized protein n=1 Tax=Pleurodeles waltl TaxID=8319 RepID=A0AAV7T675_PLEWA|nr:hypothetical protein NDU88_003747 [Pleurodeles waltl]